MKKSFAIAVGAILVLGLGLDAVIQSQLQRRHRSDHRMETSLRLGAIRARLEDRISANLSLIHGVASFIAAHPDLSEAAFTDFAREIMRRPNLLRNIAAAPDFTIAYIFPREGNEAALGLNYRDLPKQWKQARLARETGRMEVAGPIELVQGGIGLIGRAPVFVHDGEGRRFWGLVSAVIDVERLYRQAGLFTEHASLTIAIRGKDGRGAEGAVFLGAPRLFAPETDAVVMPVTLPNGSWRLAALPAEGWDARHPSALSVHAAILLLMILAVAVAYKFLKKNSALEKAQSRLAEAQVIAHLGNWELDIPNSALWWSDETYRIFGLDREGFTPTLDDFLMRVHPEDRDRVMAAFERSLSEKSPYAVEHRIVRPDGEIRYVLEQGESRYDREGAPYRSMGTVLDITDRKRIEEELRGEEEKLRAMSEAAYDALVMIDSDDRVIFWNSAAEKLFGYKTEEAMGKPMHDLVALEADRLKAREGLKTFALTGDGPVVGSIKSFTAKRKDGSTMPVERSVASFRIGDRWYAVGSVRDITERTAYENRLKELATTDTLTGLPNRRHFMKKLRDEFRRSRRYGRSMALLMFDADRFKSVNDTYGHDVGDRTLRTVADACRSAIRETDTPGRLGGEEFAVVLPEIDGPTAMQAAERLRAAVSAAKIQTLDGPLTMTVSIGVALLTDGVADADTLLKMADRAQYRAKEKGRNRVEFADV